MSLPVIRIFITAEENLSHSLQKWRYHHTGASCRYDGCHCSGEMRIQTEDDTWYTAIVGGGFAQIINNRVTVLADSIERPEDIDLKRARDAKERAEEAASPETESAGILCF